MRARRATRATSIERIKNTRIHSSRRFRRHRSRKTRFRLDSIVPIRTAYLPSSADTIETRSIECRGHDAARETRRRRATRGDAPGDGGGRELRGRGHGWRETSTSADADDDDDDDEEDDDEDDRPLDRPLDRPTGRRAGMGGPPVVPLMGVRTSRLRVRGGGCGRDDPCPSVSPRTRGTYSSPHTRYEHTQRERETYIRHHRVARPNGRNVAPHVDARARDDDERGMTRRGPSVDDELGELRVREANAVTRRIRRETMRSHGIV